MIATDMSNTVERVREMLRAGELTEAALNIALNNLDEVADRVAELECRPAGIVKVTPPPARGGPAVASYPIEPGCTFVRPGEVPPPPGMREVPRQMPGVGLVAFYEPDPDARVVVLDHYRRDS